MSDLAPQLRVLRDFYYKKALKLPAHEAIVHGRGLVEQPSFFTLGHLRRHLNNPLLTPAWFTLFWQGQPVDCAHAVARKSVQKGELTFLTENIIQEYLARGASVSLLGIEFLEPSINALCAAVDAPHEDVMSSAVASFSQRGAKEHVDVDAGDMLVVQTFGQTQWHIGKRALPEESVNSGLDGTTQGEITMNAGDALFLRHGISCTVQTLSPGELRLSVDIYDNDITAAAALGLLGQEFDLNCAGCYASPDAVTQKLLERANSAAYWQRVHAAQAAQREARNRGREMISANRVTHLGRLVADGTNSA